MLCSNNFENLLTNKDVMPKLILKRGFALAREIIHDHKLSILTTLEVLISGKSFGAFDANFQHLQ